ncbi:MAG: DNA mismatch repair endonuclease MutL [Lachnospiraceae bacterium]|nr:DNA mismatch repair endonuclease MutL [Lachnospiraceae bacterium]
MGNIQVLDENTINKIAAGEVIDRPASVVKELMENAIDAMASAITVEIKDGGVSLIRITDNGAGMEKEDIKTAFLRHATSKIKTAEDLLSVTSLGFRGEALSSIAAVSMVELITKTKDSIMGCRYEIQGGQEKDMEEVGVPDGTTFLIRNLFYNTPARKKFLKSAMTEAGYISDIIQRIALSHPEISIRFINNGKHMLNTSGNGNLKDVIYQIYGRDVAANLLEVHFEGNDVGINGFIGKPVISRGNRNFENYFINGRYIKSSIINKSIEEGYKNFMMQHKYPFTVLQFEVEPELIDVNVHPAKMEIRFRNGEILYSMIQEQIRDTLSGKELIPEVKPEPEKIVSEPLNQKIQKTPEIFEVHRREEMKMPLPEKKTEILREDVQYGTKEKARPLQEEKPEQMNLFDDKLLSKEARIHHKIVGQVFETYWIVEYGDKMFIIDQHAAHEKVLFERTMKKLKTKESIAQEINPPLILSLSLREGEVIKKYRDELGQLGYDIEEFGGNDYAVHSVPFDLYRLAKEELLMELIDSLTDENGLRGSSDLIMERIASMSCKAAVKGNNRLSMQEAEALIDELLTLENPYNCPHGRPTIISMSKYELEKKFKRII